MLIVFSGIFLLHIYSKFHTRITILVIMVTNFINGAHRKQFYRF